MSASNPLVYGQALTDFQQLMRQWSALAPYNAAHVMRLTGAPDVERWRSAIAAATQPLGLGERNIPLELSTVWLDQQITDELNRPFAAGALPLRAFVLQDTATTHWLGMTFDHWFADSRSVRALMRRIFACYSGGPAEVPPLRVATAPADANRTSVTHLAAIASLIRNYCRHRRAVRMSFRQPAEFSSGFLSTELPPGTLDHIRSIAKSADATVNDVFVAAAAQVLGVRTSSLRQKNRRRAWLLPPRDRVAIAAAVDRRGSKPDSDDDSFGFALGYFSIVLKEPERTPLRELTTAVAEQTRRIKTASRSARLDVDLRAARWLWNLYSDPDAQAQLFSKAMPLTAGISNVNLTGSWSDQESANSGPAVLDYRRVSPVGPLLPMVFTLTTIRDRLSLCFTHRTIAFKRNVAEQLTALFIDRLTAPDSP
jgi:hypothetical protein